MIQQQVKDLYFAVNRCVALPNHIITSLRYRRNPCEADLYLHLGSGVDYKPGFLNIDGNIFRQKDLWLDLRNGLPFPDRSAFLVYCCHTLEHLYPDEAIKLLREIRRTLSDHGIARIAVPSVEHALEIAQGSASALFPREFRDSKAQAINYLFCDGQHRYGYSFGLLHEFASEAGFGQVEDYSAQFGVKSKRYGRVVVGDEPLGSLVVELRR